MISVIVNCHNCLKYLDESIDSILRQTYQDWELIFWDNASTEDLQNYFSGIDDKRIKYYRGDKFLPLGMARNKAIEKANGEYIAFLDADDYWQPEKLELQIDAFNSEKDVGLVYSDAAIVHNGKKIKTFFENAEPPEGYVFDRLLSSYFLVMSSVMIRKQAIDELETWFNPNYEIIEEYDLFLRISTKWKLKCANQQLAIWRWHGESTTMKKRCLISVEKRKLLKQLKSEYPDLMSKYKSAVDVVRGKILISRALTEYYSHRSKKARKLLRLSKIKTAKGVFVYFATFFPSSLIDILYRKIKGNPLV